MKDPRKNSSGRNLCHGNMENEGEMEAVGAIHLVI